MAQAPDENFVVGPEHAVKNSFAPPADAGLNTLIIDSKMEIGAPVICADLVNIGFPELREIREDSRVTLAGFENFELKSGSNSLKFFPSGSEGDAFNFVVERDRLDKELISQAILAGAKLKIRAEFLQATENHEGLDITYRTGGKTITVRSSNLIMASGFSGQINETDRSSFTEYHFDYKRKVIPNVSTYPILETGPGFSVNYTAPRGNGQVNSLVIREESVKTEHSVQPDSYKGNEIISGSLHLMIPERVFTGQGRILNAGSVAGLYDRFFMSGFREAFLSGTLSANAIIKSDETALDLYSGFVKDEIVGKIEFQSRFRSALKKAGNEKIQELFSKLSEFEYKEVSVAEIVRRSGFSINEIEDALGFEN